MCVLLNPYVGEAPGKVILFGEHAVVYGEPAIAIPVTGVRKQVEARANESGDFTISEDADGGDQELVGRMGHLIRNELGVPKTLGAELKINSTVPLGSGLGSSASLGVSLTRALSGAWGKESSDDQVNAIAFKLEELVHGTPSGIDNSVCTLGRPVWFVKGEGPQPLTVSTSYTFLVADTGIPSQTKKVVADVRSALDADPETLMPIIKQIGDITRRARTTLTEGSPDELGPLMNENHSALRSLNVSSPEVEALVTAARDAGALGAKLAGAGRGGNIVVLSATDDTETLEEALKNAGATGVVQAQLEPSLRTEEASS